MIAATGLLQALESELRTMCADLKKKHTNIREVNDVDKWRDAELTFGCRELVVCV
jgi:hypothetical protein